MYEYKLERIDVALRAVVALYRKPRRGDSWRMLGELGLNRKEVEPALQFWTDSEMRLHSDEDIAILLDTCPQLLIGAVNLLGRYAQTAGRTEFYGKRVA